LTSNVTMCTTVARSLMHKLTFGPVVKCGTRKPRTIAAN
jgi:hypothetical protein